MLSRALGILIPALLLAPSLPAKAAPMGVEISVEIRGSTAVAPFVVQLPNVLASVSNFGPDGSFVLTTIAPVTRTLSGYNLIPITAENDAFAISAHGWFPGSADTFAPRVGGGFGGSKVLWIGNGLSLYAPILRLEDKVLGTSWSTNDNRWVGLAGQDGQIFMTAPGGFGYPQLSGAAGAWTTGTATLSGTHAVAGAFVTQLAGSDLRTPGGLGMLSLVSPIFLQDVEDDYPFSEVESELPLFAVMTLNFVPEPSSLSMVLAGAVGLGLAWRGIGSTRARRPIARPSSR